MREILCLCKIIYLTNWNTIYFIFLFRKLAHSRIDSCFLIKSQLFQKGEKLSFEFLQFCALGGNRSTIEIFYFIFSCLYQMESIGGNHTIETQLNQLEVLVLDSNAFIRGHGFDLYNKAKRIVTTAEVLAEIKDSKAKELLARLPFNLEVISPSSTACHEGKSSFNGYVLSCLMIRCIRFSRELCHKDWRFPSFK